MSESGNEYKGNINRYGCMRNDLCMDEVVVVESMVEKYHNARQKQWHADAVAVPTHLKTACLPFPNYYHPDGVFKLKERRMSIDEIIGRLVSMIGKKVSFEDMNPVIESLSSLSELIEDGSWTPCSEASPKIAGEYLVTYHPCYWGKVRPELKVGFDSFRGKTTWAKNKYQKVVAWKEKPEPYLGDVE